MKPAQTVLCLGLVPVLTALTVVNPTFAKPAPRIASVTQQRGTATDFNRYIVSLNDEQALTRRTFRVALRGKVLRLGRTIAAMNCAVVEATPAQAAALAADSRVLSVTPDRTVRAETLPPLDFNRVALGANLVNGESGYSGDSTGAGVGVAVIDSGVSAFHPDLLLRVAGFKDYVNGYDNIPYDDYGHGTHVAGLIGGSGLAGILTGSVSNYRGVAPASHFVALKVLNANGEGRVSDVIAALDWCIANKERYNLRVVNLSLSATVVGSAGSDPLCLAAERAVSAGLVVIASAGNNGGLYGTVGAPGNTPAVITVGASNTRGTAERSDDVITSFTGRGPTRGDGFIKPDLLAPGNDIISLRAPGSSIDTQYAGQTRLSSSPYYSRLTGTSMSAALVSGAAAAMIDRNTKLTPNAVKAALMYTAQVLSGFDPVTDKTTVYDPFVQGTGQLNIAGAVDLAGRIRKNTGYSGTLPVSSFIAGQTAPWAGATIPSLILRPGLVWNTSLVFGGTTGLTAAQTRDIWGSNIIWGGGDTFPPPPPRIWDEALVWGSNIIWGGGDTFPPPPPRDPSTDIAAFVWGDNIIWGGGGVIDLFPIPPTTTLIKASNIIWGGGGSIPPPPPRITDDPTYSKVGGDTQEWGGFGLLVPDPVSGLTP